jgi:hypothetical protein
MNIIAGALVFIFIVGFVAIFVLFVLAGVFSVLAIADAVSGQQVVDGRYFLRCNTYRTAFIVWPALIFFVLLQFLKNGDPNVDYGGEMMIPIVPTVITALLLNLTTSLHVISGLAALKKQNAISGGEFSLHLVLQLCCGLDIISTMILSARERSRYPNTRAEFFKRVFVKRELPIPGFFGAALGLSALACLNMINSLVPVGILEYALYFRSTDWPIKWPIRRLSSDASTFYFLLLFVLLCAVLDAARFYRKLPPGLLSQRFLQRVTAYSVVAITLELTLGALLLAILASLVTNYSAFSAMSRGSIVITDYFIFITVNVAAIAAIQASAAFYTRLVIKRGQTDGVITEETAELFKRWSLYPVAQIVAVYRLTKAIREHEEASRPASFQNWL